MTPRRLWVLLRNLPDDSPFYKAIREAEAKAAAAEKARAIDDVEQMIRSQARA